VLYGSGVLAQEAPLNHPMYDIFEATIRMIYRTPSLSLQRALTGVVIVVASVATGACERDGPDAEEAAASEQIVEQFPDRTHPTAMTTGSASSPLPQALDQPMPQPSLACFERLADAEGEMEMAHDPAWRKKALRDLAEMRASISTYRAEIDAALAVNRRSRDALQAEFDSGEMAEEDFNSARAELEMQARGLIEDRARAGLAECDI